MSTEDRALGTGAHPEGLGTKQEEQPEYLGTKSLAILMTALLLVVILFTLDQAILATAVPKITDHFHTIDDIGWYAAAYNLTVAALQPSTGKITLTST
jgi:hypothetical protein